MAYLSAPLARSPRMRRLAAAAALGLGVTMTVQAGALAKGPESVADEAEALLDSVVNISTSQTVAGSEDGVPAPQLPDGSPFQDFFDDFFNHKGGNKPESPHRVQSLGSGFVIDASGVIVTNNHVIEGADEITVNFSDGSKLKATLVGTDEKTDLAVLKVEPSKPLKATAFGDSDALRVGDWVMAIGNPFGLGGTVTVGIVSARNRDINSGPYDNFIQTDAIDQSRQFRRPAVQHGRRGHRHQHGDHLADRRLDRHRLRHPVEHGGQCDRPAPPVRRDPARLAWRAHPGGHRRGRRGPVDGSGDAARSSPGSPTRVPRR